MRASSARTNSTGQYQAVLAGLWAHAPAAGCAWVDALAHARTQKQGRGEATARFELFAAG